MKSVQSQDRVLASKIQIGSTVRFPVASNKRSALVLDLHAESEEDATRLHLTLMVMPITFLGPDRKPTGYSMGCREANFSLNVHPGQLQLEPEASAALTFEHTAEIEHEKGLEGLPTVKATLGTSGIGSEAEAAGYTRKKKTRDSLKVVGSDDGPLVRTLKSDTMGWIQWVICASPLAPRRAILQCSKDVTVRCRWPAEKKGSIRLYAPRYIYCEGIQALSPGAAMLASFFHWLKGLDFRDDWSEERFEIVEMIHER